jgi:uncharacterized membrane protein YedE/YeeE
MTEFTPIQSLGGGLLIGAAAALLLLANGRVAGISGIAGGTLGAARGDRLWRALFLIGLPLGAIASSSAGVDATGSPHASPVLLIAGGLLVGYGTQLGSGCTSGHGVCGLARGAKRSIVATATFMATGAVTVFLARHLFGGAS